MTRDPRAVQKLIRAPKCPQSGLTGPQHTQRAPSPFDSHEATDAVRSHPGSRLRKRAARPGSASSGFPNIPSEKRCAWMEEKGSEVEADV